MSTEQEQEEIRDGGPNYTDSMAPVIPLTDRARERMAARFRALGEPTRLKILERLFRSPASVGEVLEHVGGTHSSGSAPSSARRLAATPGPTQKRSPPDAPDAGRFASRDAPSGRLPSLLRAREDRRPTS